MPVKSLSDGEPKYARTKLYASEGRERSCATCEHWIHPVRTTYNAPICNNAKNRKYGLLEPNNVSNWMSEIVCDDWQRRNNA